MDLSLFISRDVNLNSEGEEMDVDTTVISRNDNGRIHENSNGQ